MEMAAIKTIDLVLLVDDNDTDNFISKRIIEITKFARRVEVKSSGKGALDYLKQHQNETENIPNLIFSGYKHAYCRWVCFPLRIRKIQ
jgi:hypothetical protein